MITDTYVYSRIGMALTSAQRVEFVTGELVSHLAEFDTDVYGITSTEFLSNSDKAKKARKTLGTTFKLLKLSNRMSIEKELDDYLKKRNLLVHHFWRTYLSTKSEEQAKKAVNFCNQFGKFSEGLESYFKGFIFFLALRHVKDRHHLSPALQEWSEDFDYFIIRALAKNKAM